MIKLLILAYDFPPYVSVGGLRPYSWYKYLHLYGIYPIVVTRQWDNRYGSQLDYVAPSDSPETEFEESERGMIIKASYNPNIANRLLLKYGDSRYRILRKGVSAFYEFGQFPLPVGPKKSVYLAADKFLKDNKVDCIIATGDPFILFKYASKLSKDYSIPWIADYRDPWIQNKSMSNNALKPWFASLERKILANVFKVTTVSTFIQKQMEENLKGKDFEIVYNGFDPEIAEIAKNIPQGDKILSVALAGTIYDWHPIESFLRACNELLTEDSDFQIELHFYGINKEDEIKDMLRSSYKLLEKSVHFYPRMANLKLIESMAKQNICLLFNYYSILGTKIFDYLAIKRKIILCYESDEEADALKEKYYAVEKEIETESKSLQADMIRATNSGIVVRDAKHLKTVLYELSDELKANGRINCSSTDIDRYSRIRQAERLAQIVKEAK